jgi:hypothetical protein
VDGRWCTPVAVQLKEWDLARTMRGGWDLWCFLSIYFDVFEWVLGWRLL